MKYRRIVVTSLIIMLSIFFMSGCTKNENELVLVTEAGFAPYEYYEDGEIVGVDIDIAKEIAKELDKKLVIKDVSFDFVINEVKSGKADFAAAGISITPERAKEVDFTKEYTISNQVVVVKKDSPIKDFEDIKNKKIAVQLGTVADLYVEENYKNAIIVSHKKYLSAVEDVKTGKADCIIMDELPAKAIVAENDNLKILDGVLFQDKYGMIVKKGNDELKEQINKVLERMINDGIIDELVLKHSK
ncbi:MAG: amino acid ABC transporter substrate-binding protein [Bacilli bacterium]|nr:amino acid ABC transporter substrate-binding protein [Bacilli bacterium]